MGEETTGPLSCATRSTPTISQKGSNARPHNKLSGKEYKKSVASTGSGADSRVTFRQGQNETHDLPESRSKVRNTAPASSDTAGASGNPDTMHHHKPQMQQQRGQGYSIPQRQKRKLDILHNKDPQKTLNQTRIADSSKQKKVIKSVKEEIIKKEDSVEVTLSKVVKNDISFLKVRKGFIPRCNYEGVNIDVKFGVSENSKDDLTPKVPLQDATDLEKDTVRTPNSSLTAPVGDKGNRRTSGFYIGQSAINIPRLNLRDDEVDGFLELPKISEFDFVVFNGKTKQHEQKATPKCSINTEAGLTVGVTSQDGSKVQNAPGKPVHDSGQSQPPHASSQAGPGHSHPAFANSAARPTIDYPMSKLPHSQEIYDSYVDGVTRHDIVSQDSPYGQSHMQYDRGEMMGMNYNPMAHPQQAIPHQQMHYGQNVHKMYPHPQSVPYPRAHGQQSRATHPLCQGDIYLSSIPVAGQQIIQDPVQFQIAQGKQLSYGQVQVHPPTVITHGNMIDGNTRKDQHQTSMPQFCAPNDMEQPYQQLRAGPHNRHQHPHEEPHVVYQHPIYPQNYTAGHTQITSKGQVHPQSRRDDPAYDSAINIQNAARYQGAISTNPPKPFDIVNPSTLKKLSNDDVSPVDSPTTQSKTLFTPVRSCILTIKDPDTLECVDVAALAAKGPSVSSSASAAKSDGGSGDAGSKAKLPIKKDEVEQSKSTCVEKVGGDNDVTEDRHRDEVGAGKLIHEVQHAVPDVPEIDVIKVKGQPCDANAGKMETEEKKDLIEGKQPAHVTGVTANATFKPKAHNKLSDNLTKGPSDGGKIEAKDPLQEEIFVTGSIGDEYTGKHASHDNHPHVAGDPQIEPLKKKDDNVEKIGRTTANGAKGAHEAAVPVKESLKLKAPSPPRKVITVQGSGNKSLKTETPKVSDDVDNSTSGKKDPIVSKVNKEIRKEYKSINEADDSLNLHKMHDEEPPCAKLDISGSGIEPANGQPPPLLAEPSDENASSTLDGKGLASDDIVPVVEVPTKTPPLTVGVDEPRNAIPNNDGDALAIETGTSKNSIGEGEARPDDGNVASDPTKGKDKDPTPSTKASTTHKKIAGKSSAHQSVYTCFQPVIKRSSHIQSKPKGDVSTAATVKSQPYSNVRIPTQVQEVTDLSAKAQGPLKQAPVSQSIQTHTASVLGDSAYDISDCELITRSRANNLEVSAITDFSSISYPKGIDIPLRSPTGGYKYSNDFMHRFRDLGYRWYCPVLDDIIHAGMQFQKRETRTGDRSMSRDGHGGGRPDWQSDGRSSKYDAYGGMNARGHPHGMIYHGAIGAQGSSRSMAGGAYYSQYVDSMSSGSRSDGGMRGSGYGYGYNGGSYRSQSELNLTHSENAWRPHSMASRFRDINSSKTEQADMIELVGNKFRGLLNKVAASNFQYVLDSLFEFDLTNEEYLNLLVDMIFEKTLSEPGFCKIYSKLCSAAAARLAETVKKDPELSSSQQESEKRCFRRVIVRKCQNEFEKQSKWKEESKKVAEEIREARINSNSLSSEEKQKLAEREYEQILIKRRALGNVKFIGDLYIENLISWKVICSCVDFLLGADNDEPEEEKIESLCKLLFTIGSVLDKKIGGDDKSSGTYSIDGILSKLRTISKSDKLSVRIKFMIQDILDLQKNNWKQKKPVTMPPRSQDVRSSSMSSYGGDRMMHHHGHVGPNSHDRDSRSSMASSKMSLSSAVPGMSGMNQYSMQAGTWQTKTKDNMQASVSAGRDFESLSNIKSLKNIGTGCDNISKSCMYLGPTHRLIKTAGQSGDDILRHPDGKGSHDTGIVSGGRSGRPLGQSHGDGVSRSAPQNVIRPAATRSKYTDRVANDTITASSEQFSKVKHGMASHEDGVISHMHSQRPSHQSQVAATGTDHKDEMAANQGDISYERLSCIYKEWSLNPTNESIYLEFKSYNDTFAKEFMKNLIFALIESKPSIIAKAFQLVTDIYRDGYIDDKSLCVDCITNAIRSVEEDGYDVPNMHKIVGSYLGTMSKANLISSLDEVMDCINSEFPFLLSTPRQKSEFEEAVKFPEAFGL